MCGVGFVAQASGQRSHDVLQLALTAVARLAHRGAQSHDRSGDGAGLLTQIPHRLLAPAIGGGPVAVGMCFLPSAAPERARAEALIDETLEELGLPVIGWRDVPVDVSVLAPRARATLPAIRQVLVGPPHADADGRSWERRLYLARKEVERRAAAQAVAPFYVCSLSCRTVVYKALLTGAELPEFFPDLRSPLFETAVAVFHQRYSTNTLPSWPLAQPFRLLAHNGEINTLWGNRNAMRGREPALASSLWGRDIERLKPVIWADGSDSANLDNALELLARSGRDPVHALMMLIPEAWERDPDIDPKLRGFYEFHAALMEPWDGPVALAFTDGKLAGAAADRNGLRPCRYKVTADGLVVAGSEVGLADLDPAEVTESGRLGPGEMLVVDTARGAVLHSAEAKSRVAARFPYARWVRRIVRPLPEGERGPPVPPVDLPRRQRAFGMTFEDVRYVMGPMADTGKDAVWSMGDDTPIPPLARAPRSLYAFVRQRFAQVTNPAIDALRESRVMSLTMYLGRRGSLLARRPTSEQLLCLERPILLDGEMAALDRAAGSEATRLDAAWDVAAGAGGLTRALDRLCGEASRAVRDGASLLVLSDRGANDRHAAIPMLLAVGAVHQHLLDAGLRIRTGLVAEPGDAWDVHHFAALFGYGAEAVHPWLALQSVTAGEGGGEGEAFRSAAEQGLLKILSKMGISTLQSYAGAQIFEALGLGAEVIDRCFPGTVSLLGGIGFDEIGEDVIARHAAAYAEADPPTRLPDHGRIRYRREGEDHGWAPPLVRALQKATRTGDGASYAAFVGQVAQRAPSSPRDLVAFRAGPTAPLEEVESVEAIRRRFFASAMSLGALSPEAHGALAIGMNRMGARSNTGEGGEDPARYVALPDGTRADHRIKQIASGRFGVTTEYLVRAEEIEIKIAQGSKPGEGGQLPGHKVTELIARLRHAVPGIPLISPPPHHDIYSIEDLAQLIHDLKQVNPAAHVGVKLVAEAGVGTVAAGVAKAYADYVVISGHNGGTGASALSSIKHAGLPWELGLAETQAVLIANGLRERIEVRADGGLRTGRDVVIAALLGAEGFGFGTAALVAIGCAMARQCHLDTCPTGIATQRPDLRRKFTGTPEQVVAYFTQLADEVRRLLAALGCRSLDEVIGRVELLTRTRCDTSSRARLIDLAPLLAPTPDKDAPRRRTAPRTVRPGVASLDAEILKELRSALERGVRFHRSYDLGNHDLSVGARIAGHIARRYGKDGPPAPVQLRFRGTAGQSFGAFALPGMQLRLEGEANDYVGKGLSGGEIVIRPFRRAAYARRGGAHVIVGNTVLYGATSGRLYAAGAAGDRFAVRNSGAVAVVEGAGDHCCEYMTGGVVVVLGPVGRNFGAGMSNGVAYVLDEAGTLASRCNPDMVGVTPLGETDERRLETLIQLHHRKTRSACAARLLGRWEDVRPLFRKVAPTNVPAPPMSADLVGGAVP